MKKTFGLLAHVDAGKTTLSERILFETGARRSCGRVDEGNTLLDSDEMERRRGITIFTGAAHFVYGDNEYDLLDTPGHMDFGAEAERAVRTMDFAVIIVSAVEGVQGHTQTIWHMLERHGVPVFFFLNKIDREGADVAGTMRQIQLLLTPDAVLMDGSEDAAENTAMLDEALMERYLSGTCTERDWQEALTRMTAQRSIFPCFCGCARSGDGVAPFLAALDALTQPVRPDALQCIPFRVRHEKNGTRLTFLKVAGGILRAKQLWNGEKINEIRLYSGERFQTAEQAEAGCICAVTGLTQPLPQDNTVVPLLRAKVLFDDSVPARTVLGWFRELEDENPELQVEWDESLQEIQIHIMGRIQLEILQECVQRKYGAHIEFGPCRILYCETIARPANGYGHFEPLRHYAEVHVRLEPAARGSGISFASELSGDVLAQQYQNLIRTHVLEKQHVGVLTGAPLTDVRVVLTAGRAHEKHTEGGDFREATYRAIRQGLMGAETVLLEPWQTFTVTCPLDDAGRVMAELQARGCTFSMPESNAAFAVIQGRGAASGLLDFGDAMVSLTRGRGMFHAQFDGYAPCGNTDEVVEAAGYEPEHDLDNPCGSVFCSHGAGYPVAWNDVPDCVHCDKV